MTQEEIVKRGKRAAAILSNPEIMLTLDEVRADLLSSWATSDPTKPEVREALFFQHLGLDNLLAYLQTYVVTAQAIEDNE